MRQRFFWALTAVLLCAAASCGARGDLDPLDDASPWASGAGGTGSGASGAGGPGSGPGAGPGSGPGAGPGSGPGSGPSTGTSTGTGGASSTSGAGAGSSTSTGAQICDDYGEPCTQCMSVGCPDIYCNCTENQSCLDFLACVNPCNGDPTCNSDCLATYADGISDAYLLIDCAGTTCNGSCQGGTDIPPCTECALETCEDEMNACFSTPSCLLLYNCLTGCPNLDLACQQACYDTYGDGVDVLQTALQCIVVNCPDVCG